ncbi:hypothetical protein PRZ48_003299 [Zasmidium cellare]|uniref:Uncharacterized protein n=1 Tax=Zasmidium cellare TaxID=395010 RepID=A0ABR0EUN1_ZASCE|nr:hypothetical protein PRZ48_003299 [Zasmidium cellare]
MAEKEEKPPSAQQQLSDWIHGHLTTPSFTFFTSSPPFTLKDLHLALVRSVKEIVNRLDPSLECMFTWARDDQHSILLDENEFFDGRVLNVDELVGMGEGIESLSRERVIQLLDMCRDEIQWERHELHRLETHCDIAEKLKAAKIRESFQYRPCPRKERDVIPGVGVITEDDRRRDSVQQSSLEDSFEIDSDAEMLEAEKWEEEEWVDEVKVKMEVDGEEEIGMKNEDEKKVQIEADNGLQAEMEAEYEKEVKMDVEDERTVKMEAEGDT